MSGNRERPLWTCPNCEKQYYRLLVNEQSDAFGGIIILIDEIPVFYYYKYSDFANIPDTIFEEEYATDLHCDECGEFIDRRTKEWRKIRRLVLEAFRNRREFNEWE